MYDYKKLIPPEIEVIGERKHLKASERYVDVIFSYPKTGETWEGSVPIEYRRTGVLAQSSEEIAQLILTAYEAMQPSNRAGWLREQRKFWDQTNRLVTRPFFEALITFGWTCRKCELPENPNWARRTQDIKELGYTFATHTSRYCNKCKENTTQLVLLALPRATETGYETWNAVLRSRILRVLNHLDVYENHVSGSYGLLPDHKFPEIRWDEKTRQDNPENMTDAQIRTKFQLLTNQRNQQKREVCRNCLQTRQRGTPFGIKYFYEGNALWPSDVPARGQVAEKGCVGCGWYDMQEWRKSLNQYLTDKKS